MFHKARVWVPNKNNISQDSVTIKKVLLSFYPQKATLNSSAQTEKPELSKDCLVNKMVLRAQKQISKQIRCIGGLPLTWNSL